VKIREGGEEERKEKQKNNPSVKVKGHKGAYQIKETKLNKEAKAKKKERKQN